MTNLIVNYLPQNMTQEELSSIFFAIGPVQSCRIMMDHKTGYSYGYGFVTYRRPQDAEKAVDELDGLQIGTKRIKVSYSRPSCEEIKNTNLYVTHLPRHYTNLDLEHIFGKFGTIVQMHILNHRVTGQSRGVAFVRFNKRDEAERAIAELNGKQLEGGTGPPLAVKVAEDHGKLKAAFYLGFNAAIRSQTHFTPSYRC